MLTIRVRDITVRPIVVQVRLREDENAPQTGNRAVVWQKDPRRQTTLVIQRVVEVSENAFHLELS